VPPIVATRRQSVAVIDPAQGRVVADYRLSATPESMVSGAGGVWVGTSGDSVTPIGRDARRAGAPVGTCCDPAFMAYGDGALWTYDGVSHLVEIASGQVVASRALWHCTPNGIPQLTANACGDTGGVAVVRHEVWVGRALNGSNAAADGELVRVDASNIRHILGTVKNVVTGLLASRDPSEVWSLRRQGNEMNAISVPQHRPVYGTGFNGQDEMRTTRTDRWTRLRLGRYRQRTAVPKYVAGRLQPVQHRRGHHRPSHHEQWRLGSTRERPSRAGRTRRRPRHPPLPLGTNRPHSARGHRPTSVGGASLEPSPRPRHAITERT